MRRIKSMPYQINNYEERDEVNNIKKSNSLYNLQEFIIKHPLIIRPPSTENSERKVIVTNVSEEDSDD
tara:strand:- start:359 stop:562 length:204 start_codon:yes stop_codon:yes gene_type:complete